MNTPVLSVVLVVCLMASAFYSGAETGLMSVSRIRLRRLHRGGDGRIKRLGAMLSRIEDPILTCLIGNNLFNVLGSAVVAAVMVARFGPRGDILAAAVVAPLVIVFGEILPKMMFREFPEGMTLAVARPLRWSMILFAPLRWVMLAYSTLLDRLLPGDRPMAKGVLDRKRLVSLLRTHAAAGRDRTFTEHLERSLDLATLSLTGIMTPASRVVSLAIDATPEQCREMAAASGFSRLPVRDRGERLIGWVLVRDLLLNELPAGRPAPPALLRDCALVDQDMSPWALLDELRWQQQQMAIVVDGEGEPRGLVTLEDLLEVLVGHIEDEHDRPLMPSFLAGRR